MSPSCVSLPTSLMNSVRHKTLPNKNVEVMVTIGYSMQSANQAAVQAIRKELAAKSEELAKQLDKLGY